MYGLHTHVHKHKHTAQTHTHTHMHIYTYTSMHIYISMHTYTYVYIYYMYFTYTCRASLVAQTVKNLPAMKETWVQSLGWEDPLKKGMATHPSILAWRIPWTEEPGGLQSMGSQSPT